MKYIIISLVMLCIVVFLLTYPFKVIISNKSNYLYVNISNFLTLKVNLLLLLDKAKSGGLKDRDKGIGIIKKLRFKTIDVDVKGLNLDYSLSGAYYGVICAISGISKKYLEAKKIEFNYNLEYMGDKSVEFQSVIRARAITLIKTINRI